MCTLCTISYNSARTQKGNDVYILQLVYVYLAHGKYLKIISKEN